MRKEDDRWTDSFRRKLDDFEVPASSGLWERIESGLPAPKRKLRPFIWKAASAAACAAVLAGAYFLMSSPERTQPVSPEENGRSLISESVSGGKTVAKSGNTCLAEAIRKNQTAAVRTDDETLAAAEQTTLADAVFETIAAPAAKDEIPLPGDTAVRLAEPADKELRFFERGNTSLQKAGMAAGHQTTRNSGKWHLALSVGNRFGSGADASSNGFSPLSDTRFGESSMACPENVPSSDDRTETPFQESYYKVLANTIDNDVRTEDVYNFPVVYSATFRYMVTGRWGLNVGLSYAVSTSERRSGSGTDYYSTKQKMQFIGIPVGISYTFLDIRRLSLYALAGGSIEKCLSATKRDVVVAGREQPAVRKEKLDARPWQGAVNAGAGIQFNLSEHYGLFAEPAVVWDLSDNGSLPLSRRRDFGFQLSVGLRVSY